jgi:tRNA A-37 threonylcarbamoyl transferase component Bud32
MAKVLIRDSTVTKTMSPHEFELQSYAAEIGLAPRIIRSKYLRDGSMRVTMERILPMCVCDMYGYEEEDIPAHIWKGVRKIVKTLFNHGIEYPDITGYNFIEDQKGRIWIIDFEHAYYTGPRPNRFVRKFINGHNSWNPWFA